MPCYFVTIGRELNQSWLEMGLLAPAGNGSREQRAQIIIVLSILCTITAFYLVKEHYSNDLSFCDSVGGGLFSCSSVNKSEYSEFLGVPVAVFGAIWSMVLAFGAYEVYKNEKVAYFTTALLLWSFLGILFIFYMVTAEIILGAVCLFCTIIHILTIIIFYHAIKLYIDLPVKPSAATFLHGMRYILLSVFVICILPVFLFNLGGQVPPTTHVLETEGDDYFTKLANCLTKNQIKMFGSDSCGNCRRQKTIFGDAFDNVEYVECGQQQQACEDNKITSYPTWIQFSPDGDEITRHKGVMSAQQLEDYSGCKISL